MNQKALLIIPIAMLALSLIFLFWKINTTGLNLDIDLKGGTQISIETPTAVNIATIEGILKDYKTSVRSAGGLSGSLLIIEFDTSVKSEDVMNTLKENGYTFTKFSVQTIGPSLGGAFFKQAQIAIGIAFLFMAVTVFIIFRIPLPSFYVVLCGFADLVEALAISQFLGIKLSLATFSALLLLIGYSVDTDVLQTTRVLKSAEADPRKKIRGAMKTGLTMIGATAAAMLALFVISTSSIITQIASVLLIGLIMDIPNTWILNSGLLLWYVERRRKNVKTTP